MPNETLVEQAQQQAEYMSALLEKAKNIALKTSVEELIFDPQGHVLIDVPSDATHLEALGIKPTPTTTVSLDIKDIPELQAAFKTKLTTALTAQINQSWTHYFSLQTATADQIVEAYDKVSTGSVIALQQEFHFNLGLALRTYQKHLPPDKFTGKEAGLAKAYQYATRKVNALIMDAFAKALIASTHNGVVNVSQLNQAMDKARATIMPQAHTILLNEIIWYTGVVITPKELKKLNGKTLQENAEETTATPNDILHTDSKFGLATWIAGSEETAHHRVRGERLADRQIITQGYENQKVVANKNPRIQIRSPSIALKEEEEFEPVENLKLAVEEHHFIDDVLIKLDHVKDKYKLGKYLSGNEKKPKAFVYNLLTSFSNRQNNIGDRIDESSNRQAQSALHILKGAHQYNAKQVQSDNPVLCFVQGIPVNGFGNQLSLSPQDPLLIEAHLMSEMALLHTLYEHTSDASQRAQIERVFAEYKQFLTTAPRGEYFSQSPQYTEASRLITTIKSSWKAPRQQPVAGPINTLQASLKQLMAHDLHATNNGRLIQALSVSLEEASIVGCKSGNERAQMVNGRVALFDMLINTPEDKLSAEGKDIQKKLTTLANATGASDVKTAAEALELAVDKAYNALNTQSAASIISLVDQGAAAKVEAKSTYVDLFDTTNNAEARADVMSNVQQSNAGAMQAHKGLTKQMISAANGHQQGAFNRLTSTLGTVLAWAVSVCTVGTILIFPFIYGLADNYFKRVTHAKENDRNLKAFDSTTTYLAGNSSRTILAGLGSAGESKKYTPVAVVEPMTDANEVDAKSPLSVIPNRVQTGSNSSEDEQTPTTQSPHV